jgi:hypothetical protein
MGPTVCCSPLVRRGLGWLLRRRVRWSRERGDACRPLPQPITPRQRAQEATPWAGRADTPPGAACAQEATPPTAPRAVPPAPMPVSTRRPRGVDTSRPCCPHPTCEERGWMGLGHLRAHGPPHGGPWRQWPGRAGGDAVFETHGTLGPGTCVPDARMVRVIACWAEGIGRRGTARVVEGGPNTVLPWWVEAAARCRACADDVRHDGSPRPGHWDARDAE